MAIFEKAIVGGAYSLKGFLWILCVFMTQRSLHGEGLVLWVYSAELVNIT